MKISLIIPAYNEEKNISGTLEKYDDFFEKKFGRDYEIIIVPNNCTDNTLEIVKNFYKGHKQIKILNLQYYTGKGGAVMKGFEIAKGEYVGFVDADISTNPENFFKLYKNKGNFDGIIASRRINGAIIKPKRKLNRELSSYLFNKLVNLLFDLKFKDTQCGAKLFKKETITILLKNYTEKGWIFDVDLLCLCKKNKLKILECPIHWKELKSSKLTFKDGLISTLKLFKYRFKNKR